MTTNSANSTCAKRLSRQGTKHHEMYIVDIDDKDDHYQRQQTDETPANGQQHFLTPTPA